MDITSYRNFFNEAPNAHLISALCSMYLAFHNPQDSQRHMARLNASIEKAKALAAQSPHLSSVQSFRNVFSDPQATQEYALRAIAFHDR